MRVLLTTLNAKYIHLNLAIRLLYELFKKNHNLFLKEFTIKEDKGTIADFCKEYDASLSSGETFASNGFSYFDAGTGIVYSYKDGDDYTPSNDGKSFNVGFAAYHVNKPKYSFMNNSSERLSVRYSAFANAIIGQRNSNWSFLPGVYYQLQGKAQEILIGSSVKYCVSEGSDVTGFNKSTYVSFGAYFRTKDAFILRAMLEWSDFSIGLAYDVNVSNLRTVSNTKGGAEIFLRYNMGSGFLWK